MKPYYAHAGITIYHGDCREVLPSIQYGLVVTDPPYGIKHESNHGASWAKTQIPYDGDTSVRDEAIHICLGHPMAVFGSWKSIKPKYLKGVLIWDKGPAFGMGDLSFPWKNSFDEIYIIGEGWMSDHRDEGIIRGHVQVSWESHGRSHPNQKPVSLLRYLIRRHSANVIVDPFAGSGTTLIAAKDLGRRAIGIEIEEKYCEIAAKRLSQEVLDFSGMSS